MQPSSPFRFCATQVGVPESVGSTAIPCSAASSTTGSKDEKSIWPGPSGAITCHGTTIRIVPTRPSPMRVTSSGVNCACGTTPKKARGAPEGVPPP